MELSTSENTFFNLISNETRRSNVIPVLEICFLQNLFKK